MAMSYAKNKKYILKYKAAHADLCRAINRKYKTRQYQWQKASRLFLNILLECREDEGN